MKKPLLILIMLVTIMSSCKLDEAGFKQNTIKADDAGNVTTGSIQGMWFLKTQVAVGKLLGLPINQTDQGTIDDYYFFKANNAVTVASSQNGIEEGTYTYNPATLKLVITTPSDSVEFKVKKVTNDEMILISSVSLPAELTSLTYTLTFSR